MKKIILLCFLLFMMNIISCKKNTGDNNALSITQKIQNRWNLAHIMNYVYAGMTTNLDYIDTLTVGTLGDYIEFKADQRAYSNIGGFKDTNDYSILGDNKFVLGNDTFDISILTTNQFVLSISDRSSATWYDNVISLTR